MKFSLRKLRHLPLLPSLNGEGPEGKGVGHFAVKKKMSFRSTLNFTILFILLLLLLVKQSNAQELFLAPSDPAIESLLDELANDHIISLNSVAKPYSREYIAVQLAEALRRDSLLSKRQIRDIQFFLGNNSVSPFSYNPLSINARNELFSISLRPILNYTQFVNNQGAFYSAGAGAGIIAAIGKHVACAAGISRTFQDCILSKPEYFTTLPGGNWNTYSDGSGSFTEWTGQLTYSWKWGSLGVFKDHFQWGNGYHGSSIFSGRAPALPFVKLHVKPARWIEFSYIHAWLNNSETDFALVNRSDQYAFASSISKHIAANLLTITPWKGLNISVGNSIVYDGHVQLAYLVPVFFYKSVDHTLSRTIDNENSQMFIDLNSRQIRHLHLFLSLYVDEFKISRIRKKDENNFLSWKAGLCLSNFPVRNLSFILEGTRTLPMTFQHYTPTLTYASDGYNLGNYLRDNSQEIYLAFLYKPVRGLSLTLSWNYAQHGDEFQYGLVANPVRLPVLKNISWQNQSVSLNASYSLLSGMIVFLNYQYRETTGDVQFTPPVFLGKTHTLSAGIQTGF